MKYPEAIKIFEKARSEYNIPEEAELEFIEKRYIELPMDLDPEHKVTIWDELVWIAQYFLGIQVFELACDMTGKIVRFRRSR